MIEVSSQNRIRIRVRVGVRTSISYNYHMSKIGICRRIIFSDIRRMSLIGPNPVFACKPLDIALFEFRVMIFGTLFGVGWGGGSIGVPVSMV